MNRRNYVSCQNENSHKLHSDLTLASNDGCIKDLRNCFPLAMAKDDHPCSANQHPSMTVHNKQLSSHLTCFNGADNSQSFIPKPVSNELNCGLISKGHSKEHFVNSDNWNSSEEAKQSVIVGPDINLEGEYKIANPTAGMSREDIIARRKLKVIDLRKKKKLEKQQPASHLIHMTSDFELINTSEDYPDLSTARTSKKKVRNNRLDRANEIENKTEDSRRNRGMEKSWKPKVKDPISIDIGQALQIKHEVCILGQDNIPTERQLVIFVYHSLFKSVVLILHSVILFCLPDPLSRNIFLKYLQVLKYKLSYVKFLSLEN